MMAKTICAANSAAKLAHVPAKHALGLDPRVGIRFAGEDMRHHQKQRRLPAVAARSGALPRRSEGGKFCRGGIICRGGMPPPRATALFYRRFFFGTRLAQLDAGILGPQLAAYPEVLP
jgi:hypothetical protein